MHFLLRYAATHNRQSTHHRYVILFCFENKTLLTTMMMMMTTMIFTFHTICLFCVVFSTIQYGDYRLQFGTTRMPNTYCFVWFNYTESLHTLVIPMDEARVQCKIQAKLMWG